MGLLGVDFGTWRAAWEAALEQFSYGYEAEEREYRRLNPAPTFKAYLIAQTGAGWPMSGTEPKRRSWDAEDPLHARDLREVW